MGEAGESNFRDELEKVWVPKNVGEIEGLLLTIQNEPGKKILKHEIQQALKERKRSRIGNWDNNWSRYWPENWTDYWNEWKNS